MARRTGNAWLSVAQPVLDEYVARKQAEENGEPYEGPMDDRSYQIINDYKFSGEPLERYYNQVEFPAGIQNKLFNMWSDRNIKSDIDYLDETWGSQIRVLGSWWVDTGTQGGMQEPEPPANPEDPVGPPTGTPFYPIPNNAYLYMPDYVEYDEEGNEISRTPATSNADLRDVNLMFGQHPRDFTEYE